ncbi:MAG: class I SAM-dependent methyltransferase, partial [Chloroflexota bacterium]|nr:class I SAM-dependent methyltransferase [Chloroflexota bacterium]
MVASLDQLDWLLGPAGRAVLADLPPGELTPQQVLRLGGTLRRNHPPDRVAAAFALHDLRLRARAKFARADEMVFTRAGLEQASAEAVARHRAVRFRGVGRLADLCTGIGGDLIALAGVAPTL